ncbi:hypothetical protein ACFWYW_59095 [Nonomuraea sp. NPDC059023]|uniref:hypothetical protein n=1 Tax=unclassified Nonomuraea TaxID=2593643 RepID=UPI0036AA80AE
MAEIGDGYRLPCHWYENPDHPGERFLIPCCDERVQDWDADCRCELPVDELVRLRDEVAGARTDREWAIRELRAMEIVMARRPDFGAVMKEARKVREEMWGHG